MTRYFALLRSTTLTLIFTMVFMQVSPLVRATEPVQAPEDGPTTVYSSDTVDDTEATMAVDSLDGEQANSSDRTLSDGAIALWQSMDTDTKANVQKSIQDGVNAYKAGDQDAATEAFLGAQKQATEGAQGLSGDTEKWAEWIVEMIFFAAEFYYMFPEQIGPDIIEWGEIVTEAFVDWTEPFTDYLLDILLPNPFQDLVEEAEEGSRLNNPDSAMNSPNYDGSLYDPATDTYHPTAMNDTDGDGLLNIHDPAINDPNNPAGTTQNDNGSVTVIVDNPDQGTQTIVITNADGTVIYSDQDGDGVADDKDDFPHNPDRHDNGYDPLADSDQDGLLDLHDPYPHNPSHPDGTSGQSQVTTVSVGGGIVPEGEATTITTTLSNGNMYHTEISPDGSSVTIVRASDLTLLTSFCYDESGHSIACE